MPIAIIPKARSLVCPWKSFYRMFALNDAILPSIYPPSGRLSNSTLTFAYPTVSDPVKKLEEYFSRSGTQLLELHFTFSNSDYDEPDLDIWEFQRDFSLVETAIAHACRWRRFTLFSDEVILAFDFFDRVGRIYAPDLEYLAVCFSSFESAKIPSPGNTNPLVLTRGAPRLCAVRINALAPFHSPPPLSNITTLAIQGSEDEVDESFQFGFHTFTPS